MTRPLEIVAVEWDDAHGSVASDVDLEEEHKPVIMTTIGFLLQWDALGLSIANERSDGEYRGHTFIPRGMVRTIRTVTKQRLSRRPLFYERVTPIVVP